MATSVLQPLQERSLDLAIEKGSFITTSHIEEYKNVDSSSYDESLFVIDDITWIEGTMRLSF